VFGTKNKNSHPPPPGYVWAVHGAGTPAYVCSPMHSVMNVSFIITGVLTLAGAIAL
jgi:hypothetical protein